MFSGRFHAIWGLMVWSVLIGSPQSIAWAEDRGFQDDPVTVVIRVTARQCLSDSKDLGQGAYRLMDRSCIDSVHSACVAISGVGRIQEDDCVLSEREIWKSIRSDLLRELTDAFSVNRGAYWDGPESAALWEKDLVEADKLWEGATESSCAFLSELYGESILANEVESACLAQAEAERALQYQSWLER